MKHLFLVLALSLQAWCSGAVVHPNPFSTNGSSSFAATVTSTTAGNSLICITEVIGSSATSVGCSASGATFTSRGFLSLNRKMGWSQADGISAGITTVTITPSTFEQMQGFVLEVSGVTGFDLLNTGHPNSFAQANPQTCGSITTTNANDFLIAFWSDIEDKAGTYSGFTSGWNGGTSANSSDYATINESSTGTLSPQSNYSVTSNQEIDCAVIALKQSGSAAPICTITLTGAGQC